MVKKTIVLILLTISTVHAVTVEDATVAYGRLLVSIGMFNVTSVALTQSQAQLNRQLEKQLKSAEALNTATAYNVSQYKVLSGTSGAIVDLKASSINMIRIENEAEIAYSKLLSKKIESDDIKQLQKD